MGKKSKANRNKTTVATSAATATATATVTTTTIPGFGVLRSGGELLESFPESKSYTKAQSFVKKGNQSKAKKILLQGIESGCVPCMDKYAMQILFEGVTEESRIARKYWKDNTRLHLVLPLSLEGAIRGSTGAISNIIPVYSQLTRWMDEVENIAIYESEPASPVINYWMKYFRKNEDKESRAVGRQVCKQMKEASGEWCCVCHKKDSDAITLRKCEGCKYYYYCSTDCQSNHWRAGHAGICRHFGLLKKYHRPFAAKIRNDIVVQGIAPIAIPELQELRHRLGLSRPQADYQELLDGAQSLRLDSVQLILPRNDGTVQIGSFPRPI